MIHFQKESRPTCSSRGMRGGGRKGLKAKLNFHSKEVGPPLDMLPILLLLLLPPGHAPTPVRICVSEHLSKACGEMANDLPDAFSCVLAPDTLGCLGKVEKGEADITNVDPAALYLAGKFFELQPITTELVDGAPFKYEAVALVRKGHDIESPEDLHNKSSCHTGMGRTAGWHIPLGRLLSSGAMVQDCEEGELSAVQKFFDGSCVPGKWSSDSIVEKKLKSKYPHLCSRCKDPSTCSEGDAYAGYEGVLRCIEEGAADVAFTKLPALRNYLAKHPEFEDKAELLCFEGGRKSVRDPHSCTWGVRPTNAFVAKTDDPELEERLVGILLQIQSQYSIPKARLPNWYHKTFLSHPEVTALRPAALDKRSYLQYLGDFVHALHKPRPSCAGDPDNKVAFCVTSREEVSRCTDYSRAAEGKGLWPDITCVEASSKTACMQLLKDGHAHLLVLDGGDVYKGGRYFDLQPIASELYNGSDAAYFAVAVLRSASDVTQLAELKDLRSCHTGIGRTAGWVMPVGALAGRGLLAPQSKDCGLIRAMADFFSAGSCVPGANDTKYNRDRTRSEDLCKHCIGDENGSYKCSRDSPERFGGYAGALRCLAEGGGDVAFVKHTTVADYTDGRSKMRWTRDLLSSDFMLLCDGGGTAPVAAYADCNLGRVPAHQVVTGKNVSEGQRLSLVRLLADSVEHFGGDSSPLFRLFRRGDVPDLLFKDSATGLRVTPLHHSFEDVLGQKFLEASRLTDPKQC